MLPYFFVMVLSPQRRLGSSDIIPSPCEGEG